MSVNLNAISGRLYLPMLIKSVNSLLEQSIQPTYLTLAQTSRSILISVFPMKGINRGNDNWSFASGILWLLIISLACDRMNTCYRLLRQYIFGKFAKIWRTGTNISIFRWNLARSKFFAPFFMVTSPFMNVRVISVSIGFSFLLFRWLIEYD